MGNKYTYLNFFLVLTWLTSSLITSACGFHIRQWFLIKHLNMLNIPCQFTYSLTNHVSEWCTRLLHGKAVLWHMYACNIYLLHKYYSISISFCKSALDRALFKHKTYTCRISSTFSFIINYKSIYVTQYASEIFQNRTPLGSTMYQ